jgi:hypothetical protein
MHHLLRNNDVRDDMIQESRTMSGVAAGERQDEGHGRMVAGRSVVRSYGLDHVGSCVLSTAAYDCDHLQA